MQALGDDDRASILETIDDDVLKRQDIVFRSTSGDADGDRLAFAGELTLRRDDAAAALRARVRRRRG